MIFYSKGLDSKNTWLSWNRCAAIQFLNTVHLLSSCIYWRVAGVCVDSSGADKIHIRCCECLQKSCPDWRDPFLLGDGASVLDEGPPHSVAACYWCSLSSMMFTHTHTHTHTHTLPSSKLWTSAKLSFGRWISVSAKCSNDSNKRC